MSRIIRGEWGPGCALPPEVDLARRYDCARATVNRALRELAEEGYLDRKRKSGTRVRAAPVRQARFVMPITRTEIEGQGAVYSYRLVGRDVLEAPHWVLARLGLAGSTPVLHLTAMHYADGQPFQHEDRWISLRALPEARKADFTNRGPNEWLVATVPYSDVEMGFSAVPADEDVALQLGCRVRDSLFQIDRVTWFDGVPITFVKLSFRPGYRMATRY